MVDTTTIRVARRTQQRLAQLAAENRVSIGDLLDQLVERERRASILADYNAGMAALLQDPSERAAWSDEIAWSETSAAELADRDAESTQG
ncbi:MAG: hypothetical protein JOZ81_26655 [Chloroflexi bacterium]|nr:hypothetical protein [Chloroflexota bacterium]MBV9546320.1 hypothetical protein [Chloroflexota bacterium]